MKKGYILIIFILCLCLNVYASDNDTTCKSISINGTNLTDFNSGNRNYNIKNSTLDLEIICEVNNSGATYVVTNDIINETSKTYVVLVNAVDGSSNSYYINVTLDNPKDNTNTLDSLELFDNDKKIDFSFDKTKSEFKIEVGDISEVSLKSTLTSNKSKYVSGYGNRKISLKYGINNTYVKVISESGKTRNYKLVINRSDSRSSDNSLNSLTVNGNYINLVEGVYEYNVIVKNNVNRSIIEALANDNKSIIKYEDIDLVEGDNLVIVTVTSENDKIQEYKINIFRSEEVILGYEGLENIIVEGYELEFDKEKHNYYLNVSDDTTELIIKVLPDNVSYEVFGNMDLVDGSLVLVKMKDQEETEYVYYINIKKGTNNTSDNKILGINEDIVCYSVFTIGIIMFGISLYIYLGKKK